MVIADTVENNCSHINNIFSGKKFIELVLLANKHRNKLVKREFHKGNSKNINSNTPNNQNKTSLTIELFSKLINTSAVCYQKFDISIQFKIQKKCVHKIFSKGMKFGKKIHQTCINN